MKTALSLGCAVAAVLLPASALAQSHEAFGNAGQLAISSDMRLSIESDSVNNNGGSTTTFDLAPAVDYFVIQSLSLGGQVQFTHTSRSPGNGGTSETTDLFGIGPRIGYNIPISDLFSFWPKVGVTYQHGSFGNTSESKFSIGAFAPLLLHPAPHFFVGLGPNFSTDLSNSVSTPAGPAGASVSGDGPKVTEFGVMFVVGGWFAP
jgi:hypothetical protein